MVCRVLVTEVLDMSSFMKKMTSDSAENRALQVNLLLLNNFESLLYTYKAVSLSFFVKQFLLFRGFFWQLSCGELPYGFDGTVVEILES